MAKVEPDYGKQFTNLWNPTIAKISCEYGVATTMHADWPLFKPEILTQAMDEYHRDPAKMDVQKYENSDDNDTIPEPLPLAYKEMFKAIELGCRTVYGGLNVELLEKLLIQNSLVQTSIKTGLLYLNEPDTYHSTLIYALDNSEVMYHDPARQPAMKCAVSSLIKAANGTGACIVYDL